jgi:hypothetical protein
MNACCKKIIVLILLITVLAVLTGCRDSKDEPETFVIGVDSIQIEGTVTDSLSTGVDVTLDGAPVSLTGSDFDETVDMTGSNAFTLEATDDAGNKSVLTVEIE